MNKQFEITELEQDVLKEIINIGLAKTADSLAVIARDNVLLHVPDIKLLEPASVPKFIYSEKKQDTIILSELKGEITGKTILIFSKEQAEKLSEICIGPKHSFIGNYMAMKRSLLLEVANMLTGALVTQFGNIFKVYIYGSPPIIVNSANRKDIDWASDSYSHLVLTVMTRFVNAGKAVELPLIIILDYYSVEKLVVLIRQQKNIGDLLLTS